MNLPLSTHFCLWTLLSTSYSPKQGCSHLISPCPSLLSTAMYCHAPIEHSSVSAWDSSASPSSDGWHCFFPRPFPYSLLFQCQGLSQCCTIKAPFIPLCSRFCRCRRCPPGLLFMGQQGNKQACAFQSGTWRHSKDNGTSMGTSLPSWEPPTWLAQEPLQEISACPAGSTWSVVSWLGCPLQQFA